MKSFLIFSAILLSVVVNAAAADKIRVVSIDFCADQYTLKLLPRHRILAVSNNADSHFSYMREKAVNILKVKPLAEDVILLKPDLIIRSYGGGPNAKKIFEKAGIPVLQIPFINNIEDIQNTIRSIAARLGVQDTGEQIISDMILRLSNIKKSESKRTALYMTPSGVTSGSGTLISEMLIRANLKNFQNKKGWGSIPLERLAYEEPSVVAAAFFSENYNTFMWSAMRHPVARKQIIDQQTIMIQGALTACGGWYLVDAIEALAVSANIGDR
mgnify:CR=1 FL=1|tara:strand:+ start:217 stop:1029 length:813 start_codon:yes stop_codon:yes gene_type:complete